MVAHDQRVVRPEIDDDALALLKIDRRAFVVVIADVADETDRGLRQRQQIVPSASAQSTHRLQDGITAFVNNADGKDFTVKLTVRDINIFETGPREVLVKVYDPDGKPVVRKVIPDDGVVSKAFLPPIGAWDHEAWYYAYCYMKGTQPMIRWSAFSEPDRLASVAKRDFTFADQGRQEGRLSRPRRRLHRSLRHAEDRPRAAARRRRSSRLDARSRQAVAEELRLRAARQRGHVRHVRRVR